MSQTKITIVVREKTPKDKRGVTISCSSWSQAIEEIEKLEAEFPDRLYVIEVR